MSLGSNPYVDPYDDDYTFACVYAQWLAFHMLG